jgi:hypothetical protein
MNSFAWKREEEHAIRPYEWIRSLEEEEREKRERERERRVSR